MKKKRFRLPVAKDGELLAKYGRDGGDNDIFYCFPDNSCGMSRDTRLLSNAFECTKQLSGKTLREELVERGYDITTLKFSIQKKVVSDGTV